MRHVKRKPLYPSGSSNLPMPEIWRMITENRVAVYNVPSGILFDMHRDLAARKPGVLTKVGLQTFADPLREGCAINARAAAATIVHRLEFAGKTGLHFPNIVPDVCILRAITADERGNLTYENEGAHLGGRSGDCHMEVDVQGNVNGSNLGKKPYLTAGCGGFVDITAPAKKIVFSGWFEAGAEIDLTALGLRVTKPGKFTKMVQHVEHVTFSGQRACEQGPEVLYITEGCVIRLTDQGLEATEIMPGIYPIFDIVQASQGRVILAENAHTLPLSLLAETPMALPL